MSKRRFKKCVAENNCGHIYDALVKYCPKCDSKDYRIGFYKKSGKFVTEEEETKRLQASIERSRRLQEKYAKETKKLKQEQLKNEKRAKYMWLKMSLLMVVISMLITVPLVGEDHFWLCLVSSSVFWLVFCGIADAGVGTTSSSSNSNTYKTMAVYQRKQQQKELNELNEQVEDISDRMDGF